MEISEKDIKQLNAFENFMSWEVTDVFKRFVNSRSRVVSLFTGNQVGKTNMAMYQYVLRVLGWHPVPEKNILFFECPNKHTYNIKTVPKDAVCLKCNEKISIHKRNSRTFRLCAENLPNEKSDTGKDGGSAETKNTVYPALKKWLPSYMIKKDITARNPAMSVHDPNSGMIFDGKEYQGADIIFEFVSYNQSVQSTAGVQRCGCVAEGQRVLMSDGIWRNIESIKAGDELICEALGGHTSRQRTNKVKEMKFMGVKDVYKYHCQKGISFEVTEDHRIMIPGKGKSDYKEAGLLNVGDRVVCKLSDIEGVDTMDKWFLAFLGLYLGDGYSSRKTLKITNGNDDTMKSLESMLPDNIYLRKKEFKDDHVPDYHVTDTRQGINSVVDILKLLGLYNKRSKDKFIPDALFRQTEKNIAIFLRYLYAADGWANGSIVGYCSTSYRLSQDVHLLLRRLEIRSTVNKREFANNWNTQWWVTICQSRDIIKFSDIVGIEGKMEALGKVKRSCEEKLKNKKEKSHFVKDIDNVARLNHSVAIKSIEYVGQENVYDIMMETGGWDFRKKGDKQYIRKIARSQRNNFLIQGGVVVHNCYFDEEPPSEFYKEQPPRLLAENGDIIIGLTPASYISWTYDEIFEKAKTYYRSKAICDYLSKEDGYIVKQVEHTNNSLDITVIQAATDDNPTLNSEVIEEMFSHYDDPDDIAIRRYGIFKQVSGRIFKDFEYSTHFIDGDKYFPDGIPHDTWVHARGIDYHSQTPWACAVLSISRTNEVFVWGEMNPSPEKMTTREIARALAVMGKDYKFTLNLIDPFAKATSKDNITVLDDLNRAFYDLKSENIGLGGYWQAWDTKGEKGRDAIRERLKNSKIVGKPFNNTVVKNGQKINLPTIWVLNNCKLMAQSMRQWRWEEWADSRSRSQKDAKNKPMQKWSHMCMVVEAVLKEAAFRPTNRNPTPTDRNYGYFQNRGR